MASQQHQPTLQEGIWPVLMSMRIFGLYYDNNTNSVSSKSREGQSWKKYFNSATYSLCVILLLWFNFLRFCAAVLPVDAGFPGRIIIAGWYAQCATNATVMYLGCRRLSTINIFFKHWNNLFSDELTSKGVCKRQMSRKFTMMWLVIGWTIFVVNASVILYLINSSQEETSAMRVDMIKPFSDSTIVRIVVSVLHILESGASVFPIVLVVSVCHTITLNLKQFTDSFKQHISETVSGIPSHLKCYRIRHLNLCHSVTILDGVFMYLMAVCFATNIILNCFVLYTMINSNMNLVYILTNCFWLGTGFGAMLSTSISSSLVNDAAHACMELLFTMKTDGATIDELGQLLLFEKKLTGTTVAFTVLKMVRVTKETILTIGGLFVTYFFLLIQYRIA